MARRKKSDRDKYGLAAEYPSSSSTVLVEARSNLRNPRFGHGLIVCVRVLAGGIDPMSATRAFEWNLRECALGPTPAILPFALRDARARALWVAETFRMD